MKSHFLKENDVVLSSRWQFQDGRSKGMGTEWDQAPGSPRAGVAGCAGVVSPHWAPGSPLRHGGRGEFRARRVQGQESACSGAGFGPPRRRALAQAHR